MRKIFLTYFLFAFVVVDAQKLKKEDKQLIANLQKHISYLASDSLEGRRTGTEGEQKALLYISDEFKNIGLLPKGTSNYLQPFEVDEGKEISPATHLTVGGQFLTLNKDFFPLAFSANTSIEALPSMSIQELQMPWFFVIKELLELKEQNPHFALDVHLKAKAKEFAEKGATALFVYNSTATKDGLFFNEKDRSEVLSIPVVYLTPTAVKKYFNDPSATLDIKLKTEIQPKSRKGSNVIGFIDNKAPTTVVIGAHLDHLGYGEDGNTLDPSTKQVHNGADDNASGVAAVIELARMLKSSDLKQNNYLFIGFSGEELGLYGSKFFVEHPTVDLSTVNYMINLDMIGRLKEGTPLLTVGGFGTSPSWAAAYQQRGKRGLYDNSISFKFDSSGTGPSDHTSFYLKGIPVLFYFTGLHTDYHKATDDIDKINFNGELSVVKHIFSLIESQNKTNNKLAFTKTKETLSTTSASFSVTLGIMPDYTFNGNGVRIDAVSEKRPAEKAGLKVGDVIVQLGTTPTGSMEDYMQALGNFKKGDKTTVQYNRGNQKLSAEVEF